MKTEDKIIGSINLCSIVIQVFDAGIAIVIQEINLKFAETEIIGQSFEEVSLRALLDIATFQNKFFNGRIGVN